MDKRKLNDISIEGAQIQWKNFSGEPGRFNNPGNRNFCIILEEDVAERLLADGWNIKYLNPRDEGDEPKPYIQVTVKFENFPPIVKMISSKGMVTMTEESVGILDWADIQNADVIVRPYSWEMNGKTGVKAYLKALYVTIQENEFEAKYADTPDSATESICVNGVCYAVDGINEQEPND